MTSMNRPATLRRGGLALSLVLALGACATRTEPARLDMQLPAGWSESAPAAQALRRDWWKTFQSDELVGLIDEAQAASPDLAIAAERVVQAELAVRNAGATLFPLGGPERQHRHATHRPGARRRRLQHQVDRPVARRELRDRSLGPARCRQARRRIGAGRHRLRSRDRAPVAHHRRRQRLFPDPLAASAPAHREGQPRAGREAACARRGALPQWGRLRARSQPPAQHRACRARRDIAAGGAGAPDRDRAGHPAGAGAAGLRGADSQPGWACHSAGRRRHPLGAADAPAGPRQRRGLAGGLRCRRRCRARRAPAQHRTLGVGGRRHRRAAVAGQPCSVDRRQRLDLPDAVRRRTPAQPGGLE